MLLFRLVGNRRRSSTGGNTASNSAAPNIVNSSSSAVVAPPAHDSSQATAVVNNAQFSSLKDSGSQDREYSSYFAQNYVPISLPPSIKNDTTCYSLSQSQKDFEYLVRESEKTLSQLLNIRCDALQLSKLLFQHERALENKQKVPNAQVIDYNDGSHYKGELDSNRVRHGKGTYYYPSGTVYRGEWELGGRHGLGICEFVSQNKYVGFWIQGRREGLGVFMFTKERKPIELPIPWLQKSLPMAMKPTACSGASPLTEEEMAVFDDKERYEGMFLHDQRHGFGIYYFPDGSCYAGNWKNNRRHGKGIYFFTSGRTYIGDWVNSQREGYGIMKDCNGQIIYKGEWLNDRKDGYGVQHEGGDWVTGMWKCNRIEKIIRVDFYPLKAKLRAMLYKSTKYNRAIPPCEYAFKDIAIIASN